MTQSTLGDIWRNFGSDPNAPIIHASCVAYGERGALILGASGSGKSALALELMAFGCDLVADDRVKLEAVNGTLRASAPEKLKNKIEARGFGILSAESKDETYCSIAVDVSAGYLGRFPDSVIQSFIGCEIPYFQIKGLAHSGPAIFQLLKTGMATDA